MNIIKRKHVFGLEGLQIKYFQDNSTLIFFTSPTILQICEIYIFFLRKNRTCVFSCRYKEQYLNPKISNAKRNKVLC